MSRRVHHRIALGHFSRHLVALSVVTLMCTGCTRPKVFERETEAENEEINNHMIAIEESGLGMVRAIDEADMAALDDLTKFILEQYRRTRGIPVNKGGQRVDMTGYTRMLDGASQVVGRIRDAGMSNRWDVASASYSLMRASCADCHRRYVDRQIPLRLPSLKNF